MLSGQCPVLDFNPVQVTVNLWQQGNLPDQFLPALSISLKGRCQFATGSFRPCQSLLLLAKQAVSLFQPPFLRVVLFQSFQTLALTVVLLSVIAGPGKFTFQLGQHLLLASGEFFPRQTLFDFGQFFSLTGQRPGGFFSYPELLPQNTGPILRLRPAFLQSDLSAGNLRLQ